MQSSAAHTLLDDLLAQWKEVIGADYEGYKNHAHRTVTFCLALRECTEQEQEKIAIAACFHDIGLWVANTLDYLEPSVPPAIEYLASRNLQQWSEEVGLMITEHHKIRAVSDARYPLVEAFRQADLVDFSLGLFRFGLSREFVSEVKAQYPNAGFHKMLVHKLSAWVVRHPFNPAPMMKW